jgi:hypothetical protein
MRRSLIALSTCVVAVAVAITASAQRQGETETASVLKDIPLVIGDWYQCAAMAKGVNKLRSLGKAKALAILRDTQQEGWDNDKVIIVCRMLFVNPEGWPQPVLGGSVPAIRGARQFPLFPIGLSNRVPFLLLRGYILAGKGESAPTYLDFCERLAMIYEDYRTDGCEAAAKALVATKQYRDL